MRNRIVLAALLAAACMLAGCSLKEAVQESTTAETTLPRETETTKAEPPTTEEVPQTSEEPASEPPEETIEGGCKIIVATDMHYLARDLTDFQKGFQYSIDHGDGKVMQYIWEMCFRRELVKALPDRQQ